MITITIKRLGRKVRKDSILHGLPEEQRARVNGWLFDKNLTYAQVAEGCAKMFGVRVSRSSVSRYYERQMLERMGRVSECAGARPMGGDDDGSPLANEEMSGWAREMCVGMLEGRGKSHTETAYQKTLERMAHWALEEMKWAEIEEGDLKGVLRVMRILIEARREKNDAETARLKREKFQMKAARQCLKHLTRVSSFKFSDSRGERWIKNRNSESRVRDSALQGEMRWSIDEDPPRSAERGHEVRAGLAFREAMGNSGCAKS
jgi:hypothetical protein